MRRAGFALMMVIWLGTGCLTPVSAVNNSPIQGMHQEMLSQMEDLEPKLLPLMDILWRNTVFNSPTLQLALQKLGEKTGQVKPKDKAKWTQRMLQSLIQLGGVGGSALVGNAAPLVGSNVLGRITAPDASPKRLTEITSADLVILAREVENTQSQLMLTLAGYLQALDRVQMQKSSLGILQQLTLAQNSVSGHVSAIMGSRLASHALSLEKAQQDALRYRNRLLLQAGPEAMKQVDTYLTDHPVSFEKVDS